jgi:hypothetical protein
VDGRCDRPADAKKQPRGCFFYGLHSMQYLKKKSCLRLIGNVFNIKSIEKAGSASAGSYFFC